MTALSYSISGSPLNPAVLFLHGFLGRSSDWDLVVEQLYDRFQCVLIDLPGHGASLGLNADEYSFDGASRLINNLLSDLAIRRVALVGYSLGGRLALFFALNNPELCSRLVIESARPGIEDDLEKATRRELDELWAQKLETEGMEAFVETWYNQQIFTSLQTKPELLTHLIQSRANNNPFELAKSLRGLGQGSQPSLWSGLNNFKIPVLALGGALDGKYSEIMQRIGVLNDFVRVAVIPNSGHNLHLEQPDMYITLLREFLKPIT